MVETLEQAKSFPVLIVTYNRADTFRKLLSALAPAGNREIYVFCDGPRNNTDKSQQVEIFSAAGQNGSVVLRRSPVNLGCKRAVEAGIDWVLGGAEAAIILEDDLLPHADFLAFCDSNLHRFRDDLGVQQISGSNGLGKLGRVILGSRTLFSPVPNVSGWATWSSRWQEYRAAPGRLEGRIAKQAPGKWARYGLEQRWREIIERAEDSFDGKIDSWAYPWAAWGITNELATVVPPSNLIEHHGLDARATHTSEGRFVQYDALPGAIKEPKSKKISFGYERLVTFLDIIWWVRRHPRQIMQRKFSQFMGRHLRNPS